MKQFSILVLFLFLTNASVIAQDAVVQTLNPQKCPNVQLKVPHNLIKHEAWEDGGIRVEIRITSTLPDAVLQALVVANRYELQGKKVDEDFVVTAPNLDIPVLIDGEPISENISITVTTPEYFAMNDEQLYKDIDESIIQGRSDTREELAAVLKKMRAIREDMNIHIKIVSLSTRQEVELSEVLFEKGGESVSADKITFPKID